MNESFNKQQEYKFYNIIDKFFNKRQKDTLPRYIINNNKTSFIIGDRKMDSMIKR